MAVEEWYERLREESRKFMEENQRHWDERQSEWDRRRITDERQRIESQFADQERDRRRIADQEWQLRMQDSDRRFYRSLKEIRVQFGMPLVDYSGDATAEENRWEGTLEDTSDEAESRLQQLIASSKETERRIQQSYERNQQSILEYRKQCEEFWKQDELEERERNRNLQPELVDEAESETELAPDERITNPCQEIDSVVTKKLFMASLQLKIEEPIREIESNQQFIKCPKNFQIQLQASTPTPTKQDRTPSPIPDSTTKALVDLSEGGCRDPTIAWGFGVRRGQEINIRRCSEISSSQLVVEVPRQELRERRDGFQTHFESSEVIFSPLNSSNIGVEPQEIIEIDEYHAILANSDVIEKMITEFVVNSAGLEVPSAPKVFEKMSGPVGRTIFDPDGGFDVLDYEIGGCRVIDMDSTGVVDYNSSTDALFSLKCFKHGLVLVPFDRGKANNYVLREHLVFWKVNHEPQIVVTLIFDPGGL